MQGLGKKNYFLTHWVIKENQKEAAKEALGNMFDKKRLNPSEIITPAIDLTFPENGESAGSVDKILPPSVVDWKFQKTFWMFYR